MVAYDIGNVDALVRFQLEAPISICRNSSMAEQHFCKVKVVGSSPTFGSILAVSSNGKTEVS